jgi:hypothetical protein
MTRRPENLRRQAVACARSEQGRELTAAEAEAVRTWVLATVRGTVQADIHKEDPGRTPASSRVAVCDAVHDRGGFQQGLLLVWPEQGADRRA